MGAGAMATTLVLPGVHTVSARRLGLAAMSCAELVVTDTLVAIGNDAVGCDCTGPASHTTAAVAASTAAGNHHLRTLFMSTSLPIQGYQRQHDQTGKAACGNDPDLTWIIARIAPDCACRH